MTPGPSRSVELMESDLRELIATVQSSHLRRLLTSLLGPESATWEAFREAPAAKHYHQGYRHGLLDHSLAVAQAVGALSTVFGGIDRDLAVTGALVHDIGKLDAYEFVDDETIEMTRLGRLHGEIALGHYRIRSEIEQLKAFPAELEEALLHIILSHHGSLEHGSPVVPATREATLVHMADNLSSKLGGYDRLQASLTDDAEWSAYDRGLGTSAYFGPSGPQLNATTVRAAA